MLQSFIHRLLERRHFWRHATFGEVAELYASRLLRQTATSLISIFVAVFLLKSGYSLQFIAIFYICYFGFKVIFSYPSALIIARFGPKHGILISNILMIPSMVAFTYVHQGVLWPLVVFLLCQASAICLYDLAHMVDFSKVKHADHAGKEISFMNIIDKIAAGVSPLLGGIIAWLAGPSTTVWLAVFLFAIAAVPLLRTDEPVRLRQKISFVGFPWRQTWRSFVAETAVGVDIIATVSLWPLFLTLAVFATSGNAVYAQIGGLATITLFVGFIASQLYGVLIDRRRGGELLQYANVFNALTHAIRPLVATPLSAGLINVINEAATTGHAMAFMRGMFDLADRSGHRIAYLFIIEVALNVGGTLGFAILLLCLQFADGVTALSLAFCIVSLVVLLIGTARFPLYRHK